MKRLIWSLTTLIAVVGLSACTPRSTQLSPSSPPATTSPAPISPATTPAPSQTPPVDAVGASPAQEQSIALGDFGFDEIDQLGAAGCGMTLWRPEEAAKGGGDRRFILLNGLEANSMLMKLDGEVVRFRRTAASGDEFYGQQTLQTFVSQDGNTTVKVTVTLGQPGEIESVAIQDGTLRVEQGSATVELPVVGDAGC
jgi:hypothetical protein